ncbi:hypothetical protein CDV55_101168 [Aspergillus turcosus]|uniref:Transmembrane protein n=1 Tax=Aspergillus turcosus TaxID=1245748 RepID=A0A229WWD7_9EURO|nr:hypothetical protein CDV55_101168 [Aspergillus turcosus]RLL93915.1 hypothetical protein CFD26_101313 [Aspergillus turcosus]
MYDGLQYLLLNESQTKVNSYMATKQRADQSRNSALLHHDTVQESLEKVFRSDLSSAKATISRPAMTAVERDHLYKHMMKMDNFERELILHEPTDTSMGGSQTQVFLNRLAAASQARPSELVRTQREQLGYNHEPLPKRPKWGRFNTGKPECRTIRRCRLLRLRQPLALVLALAVNGYQAINTTSPHYESGHLRLRVSDVTTLVSMALVIIKFFLGVWSTIVVWRCAYVLRDRAGFDPQSQRISFMKKHKLPPTAMWPVQWPRGFPSWMVAVSLVLMAVQPYISPLLSGAVNWDPSSVSTGNRIQVNDTNPAADLVQWYWYLAQQSDRKSYLRLAAGMANLAWANSAAVSANGTSITGNGCRHVVNRGGELAVNSTVWNLVVPCININSISWARSADDVPRNVTYLVENSTNLSIVNDNPSSYYRPGGAVLFDPNLLWNNSKTKSPWEPPPATTFSGTKSFGLLLARPGLYGPPCTSAGLGPTVFGDSRNITQYMLSFNRNCYLIGTVNLTAGVTNSSIATYISSRVVEDQTPLSSVVFEPNPWVQEALWLLPDLMTMIAVMNATLLPTYDNLDGYVELLIRQAYLAAWDMFHSSFDVGGPLFEATPQEPRIRASVSFSRVFSWLAICLLTTLGGLTLLLLTTGYKEEEEEQKEVTSEALTQLNAATTGIIDEAKPVAMDAAESIIASP